MRRLYKTGIGLTTGFIGSHTITVYTLHNSLMQLQLFSEDCCSARILTRTGTVTRNWLVTNSTLNYIARERTPKKTLVASIVALHGNGCRKASHCWLLTYSVHVTICYIWNRINRVWTMSKTQEGWQGIQPDESWPVMTWLAATWRVQCERDYDSGSQNILPLSPPDKRKYSQAPAYFFLSK
jgi:hypothetical protein